MTAKITTGAAVAAAFSALLVQAPTASACPQHAGQHASAPAQMQRVQGKILDVRTAPVRNANAQNVLVLIRTPQGNKAVLDLGDRLRNVRFEPGQTIRARGEVVMIGGNRPLLLADAFQYQGRTHQTNRVALAQERQDTRNMIQGGHGSSGASAGRILRAKRERAQQAAGLSPVPVFQPTGAEGPPNAELRW